MNKKINADHFETFDDLLHHCRMWIAEEDYDAYCRWFDFGAMKDLVNKLDELQETIKNYEKVCEE